ncbi:MAG: hypothetical protein M0P47_09480 [Bacteroidales bacterium]|nr:hypothetical protein [Bacteroidales bacterium]
MTYLLITYDKITGQLITMINAEYDIKVAYRTLDHTVSVIKKGEVLTTIEVREDYPAREFVSYCFHIADVFNI